MKKQKQISSDEAKCIGDSLYIDWNQVDLEQFRLGLIGNKKRAATNSEAGLIDDGVLLSAKIVLAHLQEFPDYFNRLEKLRAEANDYQSMRR